MSIFNHISLGANDLVKSRAFYDAALAPLGIKNIAPMGESGFLYGVDHPELLITKPRDGQPATMANGGTVGFKAATRAAVRAFHAAALAHGGTCDGAPGPRSCTPTAYAAYVRDPVGNKLCVYCFADGE